MQQNRENENDVSERVVIYFEDLVLDGEARREPSLGYRSPYIMIFLGGTGTAEHGVFRDDKHSISEEQFRELRTNGAIVVKFLVEHPWKPTGTVRLARNREGVEPAVRPMPAPKTDP
jgi:hypothetical protein